MRAVIFTKLGGEYRCDIDTVVINSENKPPRLEGLFTVHHEDGSTETRRDRINFHSIADITFVEARR